jgi:hypothetical protein
VNKFESKRAFASDFSTLQPYFSNYLRGFCFTEISFVLIRVISLIHSLLAEDQFTNNHEKGFIFSFHELATGISQTPDAKC